RLHAPALRSAVRTGPHAGRKRRRGAAEPSALRQVLRAGRRRLQPVTSLDVVIPTLNAAASLERTIASVREHGHDLCLSSSVCDAGSSADPGPVARRAGAAVATAQAGRGHQLAIGAAAGRAAWLLFLHADTALERAWATPVVSFLAQPAN